MAESEVLVVGNREATMHVGPLGSTVHVGRAIRRRPPGQQVAQFRNDQRVARQRLPCSDAPAMPTPTPRTRGTDLS